MPEVWEEGLSRLERRVTATAASIEPGAGFPHYADPASGQWTLARDGDWTGGFWVGMLWLLCVDRSKDLCPLAARWSAQLESRAGSDTIFRGFLFYYGAAVGAILTGDEAARGIAIRGARALAAAYNAAAELVPLGSDAEEASDVGSGETSIDGVQGMALLHWAARETGDESLRSVARAHALRHIELCVRADGSVCQSASIDPRTGRLVRRYTHKGSSPDSTWTRAQAWGMLGFAVNAIWQPEVPELADTAMRTADWWLEHAPSDHVPYWDFDVPAAPGVERDTSGAAIAAAALLKLATTAPPETGARYRTAAENIVAELVDRYLSPEGILSQGCYNHRIGLATSNELIWGSYYLLETLSVLSGRFAASSV